MQTLGKELAVVIRKARQGQLSLVEVEQQTRRRYMVDALVEHKFNQCRAAVACGMHRNTFSRCCALLGISVPLLKLEHNHYNRRRVPLSVRLAQQAAARA